VDRLAEVFSAVFAAGFSVDFLALGGAPMEVVLGPLLRIVVTVIDLYMWAVIINVILSWLVAFNMVNTSNRVVYTIGDFLYRITEPVLGPIRRRMPNLGGIDVSPLLLILALYFLQDVLIQFVRALV
jgi:YggT family protein